MRLEDNVVFSSDLTLDSGTPLRSGSKLDRRRFLSSATAAGLGIAASGKPGRISASRQRPPRITGSAYQRRTLKIALSPDDLIKVQPLFDLYSQENNVTITTETFPYQSLYEKLTIDLTRDGESHDVVSLDDPWMPFFGGSEWLVNLQELLEVMGGGLETEFVPGLLALGAFPEGSGLRGIPWIGNVQVFARRRDVFEELRLDPPATWEEVVSGAQAISEARRGDDLYGFGLRGEAGNSAATSFLPILRGYGGDIFPSDGTFEPQLNTEAARRAMATFLVLANLAPPGVENVGHQENGRNMASGRIAQSADIWPDQLLEMFNPQRSDVSGLIEVGLQPAAVGVAPAAMTGAWLWGIPVQSSNREAALELILWLTAKEQQKRLLLERNIPPTCLGALEDEEAVGALPFLPDVLRVLRSAVPRPRTALYPKIEEILGRYVAQAVVGQSDGDLALIAANQEIRELMVRENLLTG